MERKNCRFIFFIVARIPIVQIITVLIMGGMALWFAMNIKTGDYVDFETSIVKEEEGYVIHIPDEEGLIISDESRGKWSFQSSVGKRYNLVYQDGRFLLDTTQLNQADLQKLNDLNVKIYVDFQIKEFGLLEGYKQ